MDFRLLLLCCLLAVTQSRRLGRKPPPVLDSRIIGGGDAFPGQFPHQVSLQIMSQATYRSQHICGGTILSESWILTAVHCVRAYEKLPSADDYALIIKAGKHDLSTQEPSEQDAVVENYFKHEMFQEALGIAINDIALLKLQTPLELNERVAKAVLPMINSEPTGQVTLSGWGSISEDPEHPVRPAVLQTVSLSIIDRQTCNEDIKEVFAKKNQQLNTDLVQETNICTGPTNGGGISACAGDSGGPLVTNNDKGESVIIGIVSWGMVPCGRQGAPSIFVRVSSYVDWIGNIMKNN